VGTRSATEVRDTAALLGRSVPSALWDELRAEGLLPPDEAAGERDEEAR